MPHETPHVGRLVAALQGVMSRAKLMATLGLADRRHFATTYLRSSLDTGVIEMTLPQSPRSRNQRYRLTTLVRLGILTRERGQVKVLWGGSPAPVLVVCNPTSQIHRHGCSDGAGNSIAARCPLSLSPGTRFRCGTDPDLRACSTAPRLAIRADAR